MIQLIYKKENILYNIFDKDLINFIGKINGGQYLGFMKI